MHRRDSKAGAKENVVVKGRSRVVLHVFAPSLEIVD